MMRYVMWEQNVRNHSFEQRVEAAAAGHFDVLSISGGAYRHELAAGRTGKDLIAIAKAAGITLDFLDGVSSWTPIRHPPEANEFIRDFFSFSADEALEQCDRLGLRHVVAVAGFRPGSIPQSQAVDCFGAFCDKAATLDVRVEFEPMAVIAPTTLAQAWDIVRQADRPNSGIMFDSWHFMRSGADFTMLRAIPHGKIQNVQLADGNAVPRGTDLLDDAMFHRSFPGLGELPLTKIMNVLSETQTLNSIGPEAFTDGVDSLPAVEAGRRARAATDKVVGRPS